MKTQFLKALFALLAAGWLHAACALPLTTTFSLDPASGAISGTAGATIGWGYVLQNTDSSNWFVATDLSSTSALLGTLDTFLFDFPVLAPGSTRSISYGGGNGLASFTIDPGALAGQSETGFFTLGGEWWSGDPFAGGVLLSAAADLVADFSVTVKAPGGGGEVPAPGSLALVLAAAGAAWVVLRRSRGPVSLAAC